MTNFRCKKLDFWGRTHLLPKIRQWIWLLTLHIYSYNIYLCICNASAQIHDQLFGNKCVRPQKSQKFRQFCILFPGDNVRETHT
jgi:hypothetical protein